MSAEAMLGRMVVDGRVVARLSEPARDYLEQGAPKLMDRWGNPC